MKTWIFLLFSLLFLPGDSAASARKTVFLATTQWEPYVGQNLKNTGFVSEIIAEAFKRVGYGVETAFMPPKRVMKQVETGEYVAGYPAYYSAKRTKRFYYSDPIAHSAVGFYKRKDVEIPYKELRDLAPFKIGVCLGFAYPHAFETADYLQKEVAKNEILNLRKLIEKRIDLFITDRTVARAAISTVVPRGKDALEFMGPPLEIRSLHLILGKHRENKRILKDFNRGLQMMIEDGTMERILKEHGVGRQTADP